MKEKVLELFQDFGTISTIKKIKQTGRRKTMIYGYSFNMSTIMDDAEGVTAEFLLVDQGDLITIANFGLNEAVNPEVDVLTQLNYVNSKMLYGKLFIDDENDVHWEYSFDPNKLSSEDVLAAIRSFINGLRILLNWKEETSDES